MIFPFPDYKPILDILKLKLYGIKLEFYLDNQNLKNSLTYYKYNKEETERTIQRVIKKMIFYQNKSLIIKDLQYSISREKWKYN